MADGFITRKGGGVNVNDATATENDVLQGETFYSGDKDIKTGNIPSKGAETFTPSTSNQTISSGQYLSGTQTILGDSDLVPSNIVDGVSIFGVTGTAQTVSYYLSFDGVDDYVDVGTLGNWGSQNHTNFTFEITFSTTESGQERLLGYINDNISNLISFEMNRNSSGSSDGDNMRFFFRDNDGNETDLNFSSDKPELFDGSVNTLTFEYNYPNVDIKINGISQSLNIQETNADNFVDLNTSLVLGAINSRGTIEKNSNVDIYDFKIYNGSTLFLHYDFSEGSGTTLTDKEGNNDGTIVGATWVQE